jgi:hypothetical protein
VDVNVMATLRVEQPARAATACPVTLTALATSVSTTLEPVARQAVSGWSAADLGRPEVNGRLAAQLRPALEAQVESLGLRVERLIAVSVQESEEALAVARKRDEIEVEKQIDALTTRTEWLDFIRNFKEDYGLTSATLDALLADMESGEFNASRLRQAVQASLAGDESALTVRTQRILGPPKPPAPLPPPPRWEGAIPWLKLLAGLLLFGGLALFAISPFLGPVGLVALPLLILAALLAAGLFGAALWLDHRAGRRQRTSLAPRPLLEQLGKGDRQRMDRIVRQQLARELEALVDKVNDARSHAYREGRREEALALKSVEERADRARQDVMAERHGAAAYLAEKNINRQQLATMLLHDEALLARSAALGDRAEQVRQQVLSDALTAEMIRALDVGIAEIEHQIQARARFIQAPTA